MIQSSAPPVEYKSSFRFRRWVVTIIAVLGGIFWNVLAAAILSFRVAYTWCSPERKVRLMKPAILLFCVSLLFGQSSSPAPESKAQPPARSAASVIQQAEQAAAAHREQAMQAAAVNRQSGSVDILSDTQGVDFNAYLQRIQQDVRENWYHLIPESVEHKQGKLAIEFAIEKDGKVANMRLVASSGDVALDRPAWGSITRSDPFPPLPSEFTGPYLALRFRFLYNPDKGELASSSSKSGIAVSIFSPSDGLQVPVGGTDVVSVTVTGTKESAVKWSVSGSGCSASACGRMTGSVYVAPSTRPDPPEVTLTAISKADSTAKATVIVHIVEPASKMASKP